MLRGLYLANHNMQDASSGVTKKIAAQIAAFESLGCSMANGAIFDDSALDKAVRRLPLVPNYYDRASLALAKSLVEGEGLDFVYMRHGTCDAHTLDLLDYLHGNGVCTVVEFPTFPYDRNATGLKWHLDLAKDRRSREKMSRYVDFGVDYSGYKDIFGIPCMSISNGIAARSYRPRAAVPDPDTSIAFIGVALVTYWNGYDRLIRAMHAYRESGGAEVALSFHIVGDGDELPNLRKLVTEFGMEDAVHFHGFLSGDDLEAVYEESDIGIGSLSPSRKYKGHIMSSLKTKEYVAKGLPFIKGDVDPAFDSEEADFAFDVTDDETDIDLGAIVDWYRGLVARDPRGSLAKRIHEYSERNLTWEADLSPVVEEIGKRVAEKQENHIEQA